MNSEGTAAGRVSGTRAGDVHAYLGIPYAAPPVGELRFRPPARVTVGGGAASGPLRTVRAPAAASPGRLNDAFAPRHPPGEDCLNLNIWTPDPAATDLPVLVWIHGGGFMTTAWASPATAS